VDHAQGIKLTDPRRMCDDASFITASTFLVDGGITSAYVTPQ
jgi:hypothetical protein